MHHNKIRTIENLACVASVSVWLRSKVRPRNRIFGFGYMRNETRAIFCAVFDSFLCTEMLATQTIEKTLFSYQFGLY